MPAVLRSAFCVQQGLGSQWCGGESNTKTESKNPKVDWVGRLILMILVLDK